MSEFSKPVLSIDAALSGCIAGVIDCEGESFSRVLATDRDQAAKLIPMVQDVLSEANVAFSALGLIVTTIGPGSFTGLRIGLSTARSLGMALSIPVQGVTTFQAMAASCAQKEDTGCYAVVLETKRDDFYFQILNKDLGPDGEPLCGSAESVAQALEERENLILCGDATLRLQSALSDTSFSDIRSCNLLDPVILAELGRGLFVAAGQNAVKPEPFYMRSADVSVSNKNKREIKNFPL